MGKNINEQAFDRNKFPAQTSIDFSDKILKMSELTINQISNNSDEVFTLEDSFNLCKIETNKLINTIIANLNNDSSSNLENENFNDKDTGNNDESRSLENGLSEKNCSAVEFENENQREIELLKKDANRSVILETQNEMNVDPECDISEVQNMMPDKTTETQTLNSKNNNFPFKTKITEDLEDTSNSANHSIGNVNIPKYDSNFSRELLKNDKIIDKSVHLESESMLSNREVELQNNELKNGIFLFNNKSELNTVYSNTESLQSGTGNLEGSEINNCRITVAKDVRNATENENENAKDASLKDSTETIIQSLQLTQVADLNEENKINEENIGEDEQFNSPKKYNNPDVDDPNSYSPSLLDPIQDDDISALELFSSPNSFYFEYNTENNIENISNYTTDLVMAKNSCLKDANDTTDQKQELLINATLCSEKTSLFDYVKNTVNPSLQFVNKTWAAHTENGKAITLSNEQDSKNKNWLKDGDNEDSLYNFKKKEKEKIFFKSGTSRYQKFFTTPWKMNEESNNLYKAPTKKSGPETACDSNNFDENSYIFSKDQHANKTVEKQENNSMELKTAEKVNEGSSAVDEFSTKSNQTKETASNVIIHSKGEKERLITVALSFKEHDDIQHVLNEQLSVPEKRDNQSQVDKIDCKDPKKNDLLRQPNTEFLTNNLGICEEKISDESKNQSVPAVELCTQSNQKNCFSPLIEDVFNPTVWNFPHDLEKEQKNKAMSNCETLMNTCEFEHNERRIKHELINVRQCSTDLTILRRSQDIANSCEIKEICNVKKATPEEIVNSADIQSEIGEMIDDGDTKELITTQLLKSSDERIRETIALNETGYLKNSGERIRETIALNETGYLKNRDERIRETIALNETGYLKDVGEKKIGPTALNETDKIGGEDNSEKIIYSPYCKDKSVTANNNFKKTFKLDNNTEETLPSKEITSCNGTGSYVEFNMNEVPEKLTYSEDKCQEEETHKIAENDHQREFNTNSELRQSGEKNIPTFDKNNRIARPRKRRRHRMISYLEDNEVTDYQNSCMKLRKNRNVFQKEDERFKASSEASFSYSECSDLDVSRESCSFNELSETPTRGRKRFLRDTENETRRDVSNVQDMKLLFEMTENKLLKIEKIVTSESTKHDVNFKNIHRAYLIMKQLHPVVERMRLLSENKFKTDFSRKINQLDKQYVNLEARIHDLIKENELPFKNYACSNVEKKHESSIESVKRGNDSDEVEIISESQPKSTPCLKMYSRQSGKVSENFEKTVKKIKREKDSNSSSEFKALEELKTILAQYNTDSFSCKPFNSKCQDNSLRISSDENKIKRNINSPELNIRDKKETKPKFPSINDNTQSSKVCNADEINLEKENRNGSVVSSDVTNAEIAHSFEEDECLLSELSHNNAVQDKSVLTDHLPEEERQNKFNFLAACVKPKECLQNDSNALTTENSAEREVFSKEKNAGKFQNSKQYNFSNSCKTIDDSHSESLLKSDYLKGINLNADTHFFKNEASVSDSHTQNSIKTMPSLFNKTCNINSTTASKHSSTNPLSKLPYNIKCNKNDIKSVPGTGLKKVAVLSSMCNTSYGNLSKTEIVTEDTNSMSQSLLRNVTKNPINLNPLSIFSNNVTSLLGKQNQNCIQRSTSNTKTPSKIAKTISTQIHPNVLTTDLHSDKTLIEKNKKSVSNQIHPSVLLTCPRPNKPQFEKDIKLVPVPIHPQVLTRGPDLPNQRTVSKLVSTPNCKSSDTPVFEDVQEDPAETKMEVDNATKPELWGLLKSGVLKAQYRVLTVHTPEKLHFGSLDATGCIIAENGKSYNNVRQWCMTIPRLFQGSRKVTKAACLEKVYYQGRSLSYHKRAYQEYINQDISQENDKFSKAIDGASVPLGSDPLPTVLNLSKMKLLLMGNNEVGTAISEVEQWADVDKW